MIFTNSSKHQCEVAYFFENTTTAILDVSIAFNNSAPIFSPLGRLLSSSKAWIVLRSKAAKRWLVNVVRISAPRKLTKTSYSYVNFGVDEDGAKEGAMVATHRPNRGNTLAPAKTQTAKQQKLVVSFFGFLSSSSFWFPSSFSSSFFCKFSKVVWHSFFCNFSKVVWIVGSYFHKRRKKLFLFIFGGIVNTLLLIPFRSGRKISYQSLHRHKAPPCSTSGWIQVDSGPFRSVRSISLSFGRYTNSSRYWNQTRSTHLVTAPVTWRNASHHSSLLFLLL